MSDSVQLGHLAITGDRPIYRHVVVKRKSLINYTPLHVIHAIRKWEDEDPATRGPLSPEYAPYYEADSLKKSRVRAFGEEMAKDPTILKQTQQGAVTVGRLDGEKVPGGREPLPLRPSELCMPAMFDGESGPETAFLHAAEKLRAEFGRLSDLQFLLLSPELKSSCTLVTVVYMPIQAYPLPDRGFEVRMEYHQVTRLGPVDTSTYEVYSDTGVFPIEPPNAMSLLSMMKSVEEYQLPVQPVSIPIAMAKAEIASKITDNSSPYMPLEHK